MEDFELIELLGKGAYGKVYKSKLKENDKIFAIKMIKKSKIIKKHKLQSTKEEKNILMMVKHPFLVQLFTCF